jgi:hypothetical protein
VSEYNANLFAIAQRTQATSPKASTHRGRELEFVSMCLLELPPRLCLSSLFGKRDSVVVGVGVEKFRRLIKE